MLDAALTGCTRECVRGRVRECARGFIECLIGCYEGRLVIWTSKPPDISLQLSRGYVRGFMDRVCR